MAEGGKSAQATEGLSEEERKLITFMRTFDIKPKLRMDTPDEIANLAKALTGAKDNPDSMPLDSSAKFLTHHYPKLSIFYGEDGKGEVTWDTFRYEIESLLAARTYSQEQIMFGIRRSLKGKAGDKIRRLGPGATPEYVLEKLDSDYGTVQNKESALKKFYTCEQKPNESVESFSTRLEELFYKAVELRAFRITDTDV